MLLILSQLFLACHNVKKCESFDADTSFDRGDKGSHPSRFLKEHQEQKALSPVHEEVSFLLLIRHILEDTVIVEVIFLISPSAEISHQKELRWL